MLMLLMTGETAKYNFKTTKELLKITVKLSELCPTLLVLTTTEEIANYICKTTKEQLKITINPYE